MAMPSDDLISSALQSVQEGTSAFELVYKTHERWPLAPVGDVSAEGLRVAVLDSSFNPPTLAHLALARTRPQDDWDGDYDARLLLLSARNADKALKPGDATLAQRLRMMVLLAHDIESDAAESEQEKTTTGTVSSNVAVAVVDAPTFVAKSAVLRQVLAQRLCELDSDQKGLPVKLTFVMGFDTLERVLAPRFYPGGTADAMTAALRRFFMPPPEGDGSTAMCAWRGSVPARPNSETDPKMRETLALAEPYVTAGYVAFAELTEHEMHISSSEIRGLCAKGDELWLSMVSKSVASFIRQNNLYFLSQTGQAS